MGLAVGIRAEPLRATPCGPGNGLATVQARLDYCVQ